MAAGQQNWLVPVSLLRQLHRRHGPCRTSEPLSRRPEGSGSSDSSNSVDCALRILQVVLVVLIMTNRTLEYMLVENQSGGITSTEDTKVSPAAARRTSHE